MKIVTISDTHGKHHQLDLPSGDLLIHAGDISSRGRILEVQDFLEWFQAQDFRHKIFIAGNHDFFFERATEEEIEAIIPNNITYLNDSGVEIEGIQIWGSPITPWFFNWAFNRFRGAAIEEHWRLIPDTTDILITHGPPYGILDTTATGKMAGCEQLGKMIDLIQPKMSIFGHIHEARGIYKNDYTYFVNTAVLNLDYKLVHPPYVFDWEAIRDGDST